ncbi:MAG: heavy metal translocating P-type ATPase metal-binding domain-containing protein [Chitinophagaceae bacterium]|nr:heavy metal translocating P-type ATPase metal-binding domain-containing protein [Chitinophagaceae bacterium]MBK9486356.1 heavy metal translocating P-type ATPase metal-binding domain-containing protein [Chitinophagaceae bacterium]
MNNSKSIPVNCFHCGDVCDDTSILIEDNHFCCQGCKQVYLLLNENNLCNYYDLDKTPGLKAKGKFLAERFAYLDDEATMQKLIRFQSAAQINVSFSIPQMHCSSCIYLLENLHRIEPGVKQSQVNFQLKEVFIVFNPQETTLRKVVELLAFIGYEPYISLQDTTVKKASTFNRRQIYKIGVAGFCFSNIMMLSFPEYFSSGNIDESILKQTFNWINLALSVPVLFFSAADIFIAAWKGLRQRFLNIDAPIALAIVVTFARSYYEIIGGHGAGYLDSGTGIVFFMLIGRWFQNKTYDSFSFDRDYRSYFPLGVTVVEHGAEKNIPVTQLQKTNRIIVRNEEMIPADAVLMKGTANIDYSFVSGENTAVEKRKGDLIYAGGKQMGSIIELEIIKEPSQSYITQLWNNDIFVNKKNEDKSYIHPWSRYFTMALLSIAAGTFIFWSIVDASKILPAVTSVLIVACPCSLLLSATFTYGNMLRIFGRNKLYLKNASVIEALAKINTVVFDKTGTLTQTNAAAVNYEGQPLSVRQMAIIKTVTRQSSHPLSKIIAASIHAGTDSLLTVNSFKEYTGKGFDAMVEDMPVRMGSAGFIKADAFITQDTGTSVHVVMDKVHLGKFSVKNQYRAGVAEMVTDIKEHNSHLYVLSGDNDSENTNLKKIFGDNTPLRFNQSPQQKLDFIKSLQQQGSNVLMLGDGLNDAGALMQSQVGIAVSENSAQFSPASDAILDGTKVSLLHHFIGYAKAGKKIVTASFILSILYNIVGLSFAVQGILSPMVAAILMPASSISIVLFVSLYSSFVAHNKGL